MSKSDTNEWLKEVVELSLLYDFYGELLSASSKRAFTGYVLEDMTLAELSEETGVSRQGVYDMVKRSVNKLRDYEKKLRLVEKFENMKAETAKIKTLAGEIKAGQKDKCDDIIRLADRIIEEL